MKIYKYIYFCLTVIKVAYSFTETEEKLHKDSQKLKPDMHVWLQLLVFRWSTSRFDPEVIFTRLMYKDITSPRK